MNAMALRDGRVEALPPSQRNRAARRAAFPAEVDPPCYLLRQLRRASGAVAEVVRRLGQSAVASSGWRR
jgi:hypothetical protein